MKVGDKVRLTASGRAYIEAHVERPITDDECNGGVYVDQSQTGVLVVKLPVAFRKDTLYPANVWALTRDEYEGVAP